MTPTEKILKQIKQAQNRLDHADSVPFAFEPYEHVLKQYEVAVKALQEICEPTTTQYRGFMLRNIACVALFSIAEIGKEK